MRATDDRLRLLDVPVDEARARLEVVLAELGEPGFRARQVLRQVYGRHVRSFSDMTDLPAPLRAKLDERIRIALLEPSHRAESGDGTVKYLWRLADGNEIESVRMPGDGVSLCVSSQVGCALHCRFCATASLGLRRNLTSGEMVDQVLAMLADAPPTDTVSVVFMGMGEPGYNARAVLEACRTLNSPDGVGIGARHITISTSGVVPLIEMLAQEPLQLRLAVSLHSGEQALREDLMDVAARHPLDELLGACQAYGSVTGRRVTLEYAVMPGVNDGPEHAASLARFASQLPSKINLIPFNPVEGFEAPPSSERDAARFRDRVSASYAGDVMVRRTRGRDIEAACGMLHRARASRAETAG